MLKYKIVEKTEIFMKHVQHLNYKAKREQWKKTFFMLSEPLAWVFINGLSTVEYLNYKIKYAAVLSKR